MYESTLLYTIMVQHNDLLINDKKLLLSKTVLKQLFIGYTGFDQNIHNDWILSLWLKFKIYIQSPDLYSYKYKFSNVYH